MLYHQMVRHIDAMLGAVESLDFSQNPEVVFRTTLQKELTALGCDQADFITEFMTTGIGNNSDLEVIADLAKRYAQVVVKLLNNPTFQALSPVVQRSAIRGFAFTYNDD